MEREGRVAKPTMNVSASTVDSLEENFIKQDPDETSNGFDKGVARAQGAYRACSQAMRYELPYYRSREEAVAMLMGHTKSNSQACVFDDSAHLSITVRSLSLRIAACEQLDEYSMQFFMLAAPVLTFQLGKSMTQHNTVDRGQIQLALDKAYTSESKITTTQLAQMPLCEIRLLRNGKLYASAAIDLTAMTRNLKNTSIDLLPTSPTNAKSAPLNAPSATAIISVAALRPDGCSGGTASRIRPSLEQCGNFRMQSDAGMMDTTQRSRPQYRTNRPQSAFLASSRPSSARTVTSQAMHSSRVSSARSSISIVDGSGRSPDRLHEMHSYRDASYKDDLFWVQWRERQAIKASGGSLRHGQVLLVAEVRHGRKMGEGNAAFHQAQLSTRHDESKYIHYLKLVEDVLRDELGSSAQFIVVPDDKHDWTTPHGGRLGAFELQVVYSWGSKPVSELIHSKLAVRKWPSMAKIRSRLAKLKPIELAVRTGVECTDGTLRDVAPTPDMRFSISFGPDEAHADLQCCPRGDSTVVTLPGLSECMLVVDGTPDFERHQQHMTNLVDETGDGYLERKVQLTGTRRGFELRIETCTTAGLRRPGIQVVVEAMGRRTAACTLPDKNVFESDRSGIATVKWYGHVEQIRLLCIEAEGDGDNYIHVASWPNWCERLPIVGDLTQLPLTKVIAPARREPPTAPPQPRLEPAPAPAQYPPPKPSQKPTTVYATITEAGEDELGD